MHIAEKNQYTASPFLLWILASINYYKFSKGLITYTWIYEQWCLSWFVCVLFISSCWQQVNNYYYASFYSFLHIYTSKILYLAYIILDPWSLHIYRTSWIDCQFVSAKNTSLNYFQLAYLNLNSLICQWYKSKTFGMT